MYGVVGPLWCLRGPMDKASAYEAGDCGFESRRGLFSLLLHTSTLALSSPLRTTLRMHLIVTRPHSPRTTHALHIEYCSLSLTSGSKASPSSSPPSLTHTASRIMTHPRVGWLSWFFVISSEADLVVSALSLLFTGSLLLWRCFTHRLAFFFSSTWQCSFSCACGVAHLITSPHIVSRSFLALRPSFSRMETTDPLSSTPNDALNTILLSTKLSGRIECCTFRPRPTHSAQTRRWLLALTSEVSLPSVCPCRFGSSAWCSLCLLCLCWTG